MFPQIPPNPYAEQLARGFARLRFSAELEPEFRRWFGEINRRRIDASMLAAVVLFSLFAYKDYVLLDAEVWRVTASMRLLVIVPALAFIYALARNRSPSVHEWSMAAGAAIALYGLTTAFLLVRQVPGALPSESLLLVTFFIYFMIGVRFVTALSVSLPLLAVFPAAELYLGMPARVVAVDCTYLLAANVIGMVGGYSIEHLARTAYLATRSSEFNASHDALTGLLNRRAVLDRVATAWRQAQRESRPLALYLIDIDYFKRYNDRYGHVAGDDALAQVAEALEKSVQRPMDSVGRYGGEEFIAVAYGVDSIDSAVAIAERMRRAVFDLNLRHEGSSHGRVTVSIGVAMGEKLPSHADLIVEADLALYEAKEAGRNITRFRTVGARPAPVDEKRLPE